MIFNITLISQTEKKLIILFFIIFKFFIFNCIRYTNFEFWLCESVLSIIVLIISKINLNIFKLECFTIHKIGITFSAFSQIIIYKFLTNILYFNN